MTVNLTVIKQLWCLFDFIWLAEDVSHLKSFVCLFLFLFVQNKQHEVPQLLFLGGGKINHFLPVSVSLSLSSSSSQIYDEEKTLNNNEIQEKRKLGGGRNKTITNYTMYAWGVGGAGVGVAGLLEMVAMGQHQEVIST